jgi:hypothetical protein
MHGRPLRIKHHLETLVRKEVGTRTSTKERNPVLAKEGIRYGKTQALLYRRYLLQVLVRRLRPGIAVVVG